MGPLTGTKVVELAAIGPALFCAMPLSDLGADVVRIDRTDAAELGVPIDPRLNLVDRGRRSVAINLKTTEGLAAARRLISVADVLIEGFRPGTVERLGLGPEDCFGMNPRLVYGRVTGWGQDGPLAHAAGHDINYIALTGVLSAIGPKDRPPVPPLNLVGDYGGGALYLALGIVSALLERQRSGLGQVVDTAMVDCAASLLTSTYAHLAAEQWTDARFSNVLDGGAPWYLAYATADDAFFCVGVIEARLYAELLRLLGIADEDLPQQHHRAGWPALRARLGEVFQMKTRAEWLAILEGTDACFAPVLTLTEAPHHPHNVARRTFVEVDGLTQPAPAPRMSRTEVAVSRGPVTPGHDTEEVLGELGFSADSIAGLRTANAIR